MKNTQKRGEGSDSPKKSSKWAILAALLLCILLVALFWKNTPPSIPVEKPQAKAESPVASPAQAHPAAVADAHQKPVSFSAPLIPKPMNLTRKVILNKKWNSDPDSLGVYFPPLDAKGLQREGAIVGPHSVAYTKDTIYVLDSSGNRLLGYDNSGKLTSTVPFPGLHIGDLVANDSDSSVFVVCPLDNAIYKVKGNETLMKQSAMLWDYNAGYTYGYDEPTGTVYIHDPRKGDIPVMVNGQALADDARVAQTLSPISGDYDPNNLNDMLLKLKDGRNITVRFELHLQSVDEMWMDAKGIAWVLYTTEGDYRIRRLARVDTNEGTVGVALLNVQFRYDAIHHMTPSGNGIIIVSGDDDNGSISSYEYAGQ